MTAFRMWGLILALALTPAVTNANEQAFETLGPVAARAMAQHLAQIQTDLRTQLELVASTPGAARNDWAEVKPYLGRMAQNLPGTWWMMLANGDYYSLDRDFTKLNLADISFFGDLREGDFVPGWLGFSRSTGMRSAVFAAPIMSNGQFQGAIGASVFLDPLHARISSGIGLPERYSWFVIDAEGTNLLDPDSGWIFLNTLTDGPPSLGEAMKQALAAESGRVSYEVGGVGRQGAFQKLEGLDWRVVVIEKEPTEYGIRPDVSESLRELTARLQSRLNAMDADLGALIKSWSRRSPSTEQMRADLGQLARAQPLAVNAGYINAKGVLEMIAPSDWRNFENSDISDQAQVALIRERRAPVFSDHFQAVEGGLAVDISHPHLDRRGRFIGSVSLLIYPDVLVERVLSQLDIPEKGEVWVMHASDGIILYDADADEIGRMLLSDPIYDGFTGLRELGERMLVEERGAGNYAFQALGHEGVVHKIVEWDTVSLHGNAWRVAMAYTSGQ